MEAYLVMVSAVVTDTIVVRAKNPEDAKEVAMLCMMERLHYDKSSTALVGDDIYITTDGIGLARPGDRVDTYTCSGCGESSPKTTFGPGWMKCPKCGAPPEPADSTVE